MSIAARRRHHGAGVLRPADELPRSAKRGDELAFGDGQVMPVKGRLSGLADGSYIAGFRPNHLEIDQHAGDAMAFHCTIAVTEITGSETFIHLDHHGEPLGRPDAWGPPGHRIGADGLS
jgi:ABC-type sugar transport system ATPase subunit